MEPCGAKPLSLGNQRVGVEGVFCKFEYARSATAFGIEDNM